MNLILENKQGNLAEIDLSNGAALTKLILNKEDVIKYPLKGDDPKKGYPSAVLFPFPNRIKDGNYSFEGKDYELDINDKDGGNAIHGLVAFETFDIVSQTSSKVRLKFEYKADNDGYPFPFVLYLEYQLKSGELLFNIEVENTGDGNMPYGFGWHPYFGFDGAAVGEMSAKAPRRRNMELSERNIPTGEFEIENAGVIPLKNNILDNVYAVENPEGTSEVELRLKGKKLIVSQKTGKGKLNYFVLYTPPTRNCLAIEPQTSNTNCFNNGDGLLVLKPGKKAKFSITVRVEVS